MEFSVDPEIFARLHGMRLAVVVDAATPRVGW